MLKHICFLLIFSYILSLFFWFCIYFCATMLLSKKSLLGCRHSSVDYFAPTILPTQIRVPNTPYLHLLFIVKFMLRLYCEKNENKQKWGGVCSIHTGKSWATGKGKKDFLVLVPESAFRLWRHFCRVFDDSRATTFAYRRWRRHCCWPTSALTSSTSWRR